LNFIVSSKVLKDPQLPAGKSFNTLMLIEEDGAKAGTFEIYTSAKQAELAGITGDTLTNLQTIFMQDKAPSFVKIGYVANISTGELTKLASQTDWYLTLFKEGQVTEANAGILSKWFGAEKKIAITTDTDPKALLKTGGITKALFDAQADHMFAIYAPKVDIKGDATDDFRFISAVVAGGMATVNFDDPNSYYALAHLIRNMKGVRTVALTPDERTNLMGYTINVGYDKTVGIMGNAYISYEGYEFLYEGLMPNATAVSDVHFIDWLNNRIQQDQAIYFKQNKVTTYREKDIAGILLNFRKSLLKGVRSGGLIPEQVKVENIADLQARITDQMKSNRMLGSIFAEIKCSGQILHVSYETECVPFNRDLKL